MALSFVMCLCLCACPCFRNAGCWHVPVLGPIAFAQGSKKIDQEASSRAVVEKSGFPLLGTLLGKPANDQQVFDLAGHPTFTAF